MQNQIMQPIIEIRKQIFSGSEQNCVNARELHDFLEVQTRFNDWIERRITEYEFVENQDFVFYSNLSKTQSGRPRMEIFVSLDMAKELAMVERTEKGKQARKYFIDCEKQLSGSLNHPAIDFADPIAAAQAFIAAETERRQLAAQIAQDMPKVTFANAVSGSQGLILVRDLAKLIHQNGVSMGERRLYEWLRQNGYICKHDTKPTQKAMNLGVFEVTETVITTPKGDRLNTTTKVTGKGQVYFLNKFLGKVQ